MVAPLETRDREFENIYFRVNLGNDKPMAVASSYLKEPGKRNDLYHARNLVDGSLTSSWCTSKKKGIGETLYIPFYKTFNHSFINSKNKKHVITIRISNGYGGNPELFQKNNRAKKMSLEIYQLAYTDTVDINDETFPNYPRIIMEGPILNSKHEIEFEDNPSSCDIDIPIELSMPQGEIAKFAWPDLFLKFTILEIYPGSKYDDLCIAEMAVYGESIRLPPPLHPAR